jgi:hypothetical protein
MRGGDGAGAGGRRSAEPGEAEQKGFYFGGGHGFVAAVEAPGPGADEERTFVVARGKAAVAAANR